MAGTPDTLIRQWFEELWNRGDESTIERLLEPSVKSHFLGKAPTHNAIDFRGMVMVRVAGGQFLDGWNTFDFLTCYQQIELLPELAAQA